jgi:hypothetical protein
MTILNYTEINAFIWKNASIYTGGENKKNELRNKSRSFFLFVLDNE